MKSIKNRIIWFAAVLFALVLLGTHAQAADTEGFNSEKIIAELEKQMKLTQEQWEELKPVIEEKSRDLSKGIHESVDKGFAELDKLSKQFDEMTKEAEKKINEIVSSEEAMKFREYLSKIDKEAVAEVKDKMISDLNSLLELSEEQAKKIEPVLKESFDEFSTMMKDLTEESSRDWNEFKQEFEKLTKDLYDKVQETLDDEQMEKLEEYNEKQKDKVEHILFRA